MRKRTLGASDMLVGELGIGCWAFGGGNYWGPQDQAVVDNVVDLALDYAVNYFDTAETYNDGASEISLGRALGSRRHEAVIGSKVWPDHAGAVGVRQALEGSLRRLDTDYLDVYMLHWPLQPIPRTELHPQWQETWETMQALQQEGKIRVIGMSNHGKTQMSQVLGRGVPIAVNQLPYSLASRAIERELMPLCRDEGVGIIAYSPLQQGLLTGKYERVDEVRPNLARTRHFHHLRGGGQSRHHGQGVEEALFYMLDELRQLAQAHGVTMGTMALAWAMVPQEISVTIAGARTVEQLQDNLKATTFAIDRDLVQKLKEISQPVLEGLGPCPDYFEDVEHSRTW